MQFLKRLFSSSNDAEISSEAKVEARKAAGMRPGSNKRLSVTSFTRHFVQIPELDYFGQWSRSSDGRRRLSTRRRALAMPNGIETCFEPPWRSEAMTNSAQVPEPAPVLDGNRIDLENLTSREATVGRVRLEVPPPPSLPSRPH